MLSRLHQPERDVLQEFFDQTVRFGIRGEKPRDSRCKDLLKTYELERLPDLVYFTPSVAAGLSAKKQTKAVKTFLGGFAGDVKDLLEELCLAEDFSAWNPLQDEHVNCSLLSVKKFRMLAKIVLGNFVAGACSRTEEVLRRLKDNAGKKANVFSCMTDAFVRVMMIFSVRIGLHADRSASFTTCSLVEKILDLLTGYDESKLDRLKKKCRCEGRSYGEMLAILMQAIENDVDRESLTYLFLI
jgi:hypothetical protein